MRVRQGLQDESAVRRRPLRVARPTPRARPSAAPGLAAARPAAAVRDRARPGDVPLRRRPTAAARRSCSRRSSRRSGGPSRPAGRSCRRPRWRSTARCWSGRRTASCTTSRVTARSGGRTRRATSFSARRPSAHDGTIYIGSDDDHLYAVVPATAKPRWIVQMGACPQRVGIGPEASRCDVDAGPTVGPDGVIYTGGDGIYAINPDGTLRWRFATGGHVSSAPACCPTARWSPAARTISSTPSPPTARSAGTSAPAATSRRRPPSATTAPSTSAPTTTSSTRWAPTGTLRWAFTTGGDVRASAAVGSGIIYVGSFDSQLYAVRLDGTLAWTFRAGDRIVSSALVDARGAILFGSQDDRLYCLEPDGHLRWSVELGGDVDSSPILAADGTIFVGSDDRKLYALRAPSGAGRLVPSANAPARRTSELQYDNDNRHHPSAPSFSGLPTRILTGRIKVHPAGYGFVVPDDKSEDVHVSAPQPRRRDGRRHRRGRGLARGPRRRRARLRVLARGRAKITGQLDRRGTRAGPAARRSAHHRPVLAARARSRRQRRAQRWSPRSPATPTSRTGRIEAAVLKVLGDPDDPRTEVEKVLACADVEERFPDDVARIADGLPTEVRDVDRDRSRRPARRPVHDHRSRDRARLRRRGGDRDAAERRHAALGRGRRRLALRARGVAARHRGAGAAGAASTCPTAPSRCCPSRCRRASARWSRRRIGWRWWCASTSIATRRSIATDFCAAVIHSQARLDYPGVAAALGGDTRGKRQQVRAVPAGAAGDGRAGAAAARAAGSARGVAGLRPPGAVRRAGPRRSAAGARHPEVAPRSGRAAGLLDDRGVHAGRQRGGGAQLPRARRGRALAHPRRARSRRGWRSSRCWPQNYGIAIDVDEARTPAGAQARARPAARAIPPRSRCRSSCCGR